MAKLITTKAEREAASFFDWDDAALGMYTKKLALQIMECRTKMRSKSKVNDEVALFMSAADGMLIVGEMVRMNAGKIDLKFGDFTYDGGKPGGDWRIRIEQLPKGKK
jgi:hypothetical protein